jgi:hypothetical protein
MFSCTSRLPKYLFIVFRHIDPNLIGLAFRSFDSEDAEFEISPRRCAIDNIRIDGIAAGNPF